MNEKSCIKIETNNNWSLIEFECFISSLTNIYYTLYVCTDIIDKLPYLSLQYNYRKISIINYIKNRTHWIKDDDLLYIKSIRMESPGDIVIAGGGIVREIRELIKDLEYRNEQEKEMGQLNILEKKLEIMERYGIPKNELAKILRYTNENVESINSFKSKGLIGSIIDIKA